MYVHNPHAGHALTARIRGRVQVRPYTNARLRTTYLPTYVPTTSNRAHVVRRAKPRYTLGLLNRASGPVERKGVPRSDQVNREYLPCARDAEGYRKLVARLQSRFGSSRARNRRRTTTNCAVFRSYRRARTQSYAVQYRVVLT